MSETILGTWGGLDGGPACRITCPCGQRITLWYNGGELDWRECECGRTYWAEATEIVVKRSEPGQCDE